jgi:prephenate dehydratase
MTVKIAHLGPTGTYAEAAALAYAETEIPDADFHLQPYPNIPQTLRAVMDGETQLAILPVENSIEGSVVMTADILWLLWTDNDLQRFQIQQALVLPISHALISVATDCQQIKTVYSHPQALSQCQEWLQRHLPAAECIAVSSTTAALVDLQTQPDQAAISSVRAANLYSLPVLAHPINDYPDNQTKFWAISLQPERGGNVASIAFSLSENAPGGLVKVLGFFADRGLNLSRIESRPSKRSLGEYVFFIDIETDNYIKLKSALADAIDHVETYKYFGSYQTVTILA